MRPYVDKNAHKRISSTSKNVNKQINRVSQASLTNMRSPSTNISTYNSTSSYDTHYYYGSSCGDGNDGSCGGGNDGSCGGGDGGCGGSD
jgi:hypothetical protein